MAHPFDGLDGGPRSGKPRTSGLTMMIDWGLGPRQQADVLDVGAASFDLAKVAVGISRLLERDVLKEKITTYQKHDVDPFPGGQFFEYAETLENPDMYLPAVKEVGYRWVEVSDNMAEVTLEWKERVIRSAVENFGLKVLGEVGKKEGLGSDVGFVEDAQRCAGTGSSVILLEAAELVGDDVETAREVEAVVNTLGIEKVMFELPGPWIEGVSLLDIHAMRRSLIARYGPDVNLGNVMPEEVVSVEAYRRGLGVNAGQALE